MDEFDSLVEKKPSKGPRFIAPILIGLTVSISFIFIDGITKSENALTTYKILCDAFFVTAAILLAFFGLSYVAKEGGFDGIAYAGKSLLDMFIPTGGFRKHESYGDYILRKKEKRRKVSFEFAYVAIPFLILALVFFFLYTSIAE